MKPQIALAKALECSQSYVARLINRGMPTGSIAAAKKWRSENATRGHAGVRSKALLRKKVKPLAIAKKSAVENREVPRDYHDLVSNGGLVAEVDHLRATVARFRLEIENAKDVGIRAQAVKNYSSLINTLRQFENDLPGILARQAAVFDRKDAESSWYTVVRVFERQARTMPGRAARWLVGQKDFHLIKEILAREVEDMLAAIVSDVMAQLLPDEVRQQEAAIASSASELAAAKS